MTLLCIFLYQVFHYQGKTLYCEDAAARAKARAHITYFGKMVMPLIYKVNREPTNKEELENLLNMVKKWVKEPLRKGVISFFGGQDYNAVYVKIWPWIERFAVTVEQGVISLPTYRCGCLRGSNEECTSYC